RPNTDVVLGNHEVAMLWALRDPAQISPWMSIGGQQHDLDELRNRPDLQAWLRSRPLILRLDDGTLAQHCGHDLYQDLGATIDAINAKTAELLRNGGELELWQILSPRDLFRMSHVRLTTWLTKHGATRVVHGHTPHRQ